MDIKICSNGTMKNLSFKWLQIMTKGSVFDTDMHTTYIETYLAPNLFSVAYSLLWKYVSHINYMSVTHVLRSMSVFVCKCKISKI